MSLLSRLVNVSFNPNIEQLPLSEWTTDWIFAGSAGGLDAVGRPMTENEALMLSAVWRAATVRARTLAALPLAAYKPGTESPVSPTTVTAQLVVKPHPDLVPVVLWTTVWLHYLLHGNAFLWIIRNRAEQPAELWPIHPSRVQVSRNPITRRKEYLVDGILCDDTQIWHFMSTSLDGITGLSVLSQASQSLRLGLSQDQFAATAFDKGNLAAGVLKVAGDLDDDETRKMQLKWDAARASGVRGSWQTMVLTNGATYEPLSLPLQDMQLLESRQWTVKDVARWFGVPPFLLFDTEGSTSWGTGLEEQASGWARFDLTADAVQFEQSFSTLVWPDTAYARLSLKGLMRGDVKARGEFYNKLTQYGALTINDIRRMEELAPIEGGDEAFVPINYQALSRALTDPAAPIPEGDPA